MNIAFFGTSDRSIPLLTSLKKSDFKLSLCVTKEDSKVGRSQDVKETQVKAWARDNGVHCITISSLNTTTTEQIKEELLSRNIGLGVVADFSFMIPSQLFDQPKHKFVNIHFSLLPKYRGASPVQFAILNSESETGITYQILKKEMDTGPIIHQTKYKLTGNETSGELYDKLFDISAKELPTILKLYVDGKAKPEIQNQNEASYTYSSSHPKSTQIFKEDAKIDWTKSPKEIDALVRAFNPWPTAWTTLKELDKYLSDHPERMGLKKEKLKGSNLRVRIIMTEYEGNRLEIEKIQIEGKNALDWKEFANGYLDSVAAS